jgi:hypothetical protein
MEAFQRRVAALIAIEIPDNPNCEAVDLRVFHDVDAASPVAQVRLARDGETPRWCDVTGWTTAGRPGPARLQKVDDSGEGTAFLLYGGDAGVRLRPADGAGPWRLDDAAQWGCPFLLLTDLDDVRLSPAPRSP